MNATTYGADVAGLICGFVFRADAVPRAIDTEQASAWLREDRSGADADADGDAEVDGRADEFAWLHFNLAHTGALPWLEANAGLSDEFYEMLRNGLRSTRIERTDQSLTAVINDVHFDFAFEPSDTATLWIDVGRHLVVTARQQPLRTVDKLRRLVRDGQGVRSPAALLEHVLRTQADVLVEIVRGVTERVDDIEDQLLSRRLDHRRAKLGKLRRLLVRLQRLLAPEPAAFLRLLQHPPGWMAELDLQELRQSSEEFSVVLRDMATLQERIKLLQEEVAAEVNESNNRSLFVLTVVTVLALPINMIAGLLGMNVGGVPLAEHPNGFWIVLAIASSFTVLAVLGVLRSRARR